MNRISLTDQSGKWFDGEAATHYAEKTWHDGRNWISSATGSQFEHETIFLTASGRWILNTWSNYQGTPETYTEMDETEAAQWFSKQGFQDSEIPEKLTNQVNEFQI